MEDKEITIKDVLSRDYAVISVLGNRGSGKTYFSSQLEFRNVDKIIYIDVVGAFKDYLKKFGRDFVNVEVDKAYSKASYFDFFKKMLAVDDKIFNIDISLLRREEMINFMDYLSSFLLLYNTKRIALVIDEVGEIAEQEHIYYSHDLERLVRIGRNKGINYVVLITQRAQKVNKHLLALSDYYVIFKLVHNLDREAVKKILGMNSKDFKELDLLIKRLEVGEYFITDGVSINKKKRESKTKNTGRKREVEDKAIEYMELLRSKGLSYKQIAEVLNVDINIVKYYLIRRKDKNEGIEDNKRIGRSKGGDVKVQVKTKEKVKQGRTRKRKQRMAKKSVKSSKSKRSKKK